MPEPVVAMSLSESGFTGFLDGQDLTWAFMYGYKVIPQIVILKGSYG